MLTRGLFTSSRAAARKMLPPALLTQRKLSTVPISSVALRASLDPALSVNVPYTAGMAPGVGVDLLTGSKVGSGVEAGEMKPLEVAPGTRSTNNLTVIHTMDQLYKSLDVTASGGGSFGIYSGSFRYRKHEESMFNSQSTFILAHTVVRHSFRQFTDGALEEGALALLKQYPEEFRNKYGDMFVRGFMTGGEFYAIISITSSSMQEQSEVSSAVRAAIGGFGSGSASIDEIRRRASSRLEIQIYTNQQAGGELQHGFIGDNFEQLMEKMKNFVTISTESPVPIYAQLATYNTLDNYPSSADVVSIKSFERNIERAREYRGRYITEQNNVSFIQQYPQYYKNPPPQSVLSKWQRYLSERINEIDSVINSCSRGSLSDCSVPAFELPDGYELPQRVLSDISPEESNALGRVWYVKEGDWDGVWKRRGDTRIFDAKWTLSGNSVAATLEIHVTGKAVVVTRKDSTDYPDGFCSYQGLLDDRGTNVKGRYRCTWTPGSRANAGHWKADISHRLENVEKEGVSPIEFRR